MTTVGTRTSSRGSGRRSAMLKWSSAISGSSTSRREMLRYALPFPDIPGWQFHDHWLALVALATGRIAYVDRPLYDYVQHAGAVFGEVAGDPPLQRKRPW